MNSFNLTIITPQSTVFDGEAEYLNLPTEDGLYGIEAHHSNVIVSLSQGKLSYTAGGEKHSLHIEGGIMHFAENAAKVIARI